MSDKDTSHPELQRMLEDTSDGGFHRDVARLWLELKKDKTFKGVKFYSTINGEKIGPTIDSTSDSLPVEDWMRLRREQRKPVK